MGQRVGKAGGRVHCQQHVPKSAHPAGGGRDHGLTRLPLQKRQQSTGQVSNAILKGTTLHSSSPSGFSQTFQTI